jgi:hypothetical protein
MAVVGISVPGASDRRKPSTLENIAMGVDIAAKVLGTGVDVYKTFGVDIPKGRAETDVLKAQAADMPGDKDRKRRLDEAQIQYYGAAKAADLESKGLDIADKKRKAEESKKPKLPDAIKPTAESLSKKVTDYNAAVNYLTNELAQFSDKAKPEDVRVKIGEGMLKGLNSVLGPDAVGKDERESLGSFLKYKRGNLFEPGSFVGRDLDSFAQQIKSKIDSITATRAATANELKRIYTQYGLNELPIPEAQPNTQAPAGKPPIVVQNGIQYRLNPQTGEYE